MFSLSSLGGASQEAMSVIDTLSGRLKERFGKREGQLLTQQALERIAVATQRGVAALLLHSELGGRQKRHQPAKGEGL